MILLNQSISDIYNIAVSIVAATILIAALFNKRYFIAQILITLMPAANSLLNVLHDSGLDFATLFIDIMLIFHYIFIINFTYKQIIIIHK